MQAWNPGGRIDAMRAPGALAVTAPANPESGTADPEPAAESTGRGMPATRMRSELEPESMTGAKSPGLQVPDCPGAGAPGRRRASPGRRWSRTA